MILLGVGAENFTVLVYRIFYVYMWKLIIHVFDKYKWGGEYNKVERVVEGTQLHTA